jgi:acyl carrier protein
MDPDALVELVTKVVAEELEIPLGSLRETGSLRNDYGLDSVAAVNIIFALETKLGVTVDMRELASVDSIQDIRELLSKHRRAHEEL